MDARASNMILLRRYLVTFTVALGLLTVLQLARLVPKLSRLSIEATSPAIAKVFILSVPYIVAVTLPMAVLLSVMYVCARTSDDGVDTRGGSRIERRPMKLGFALAAIVAVVAVAWNDQVVPRANSRLRPLLVAMQADSQAVGLWDEGRSDREMTTSELRQAVVHATRAARQAAIEGDSVTERTARERATRLEVEIHKKYALAAACLPVFLIGTVLGLRLSRHSVWFLIAESYAVGAVYYVGMIAGEALGDEGTVSPAVAMWMPNVICGVVGLVALWMMRVRRRPGRRAPTVGPAPEMVTAVESGRLVSAVKWQTQLARATVACLGIVIAFNVYAIAQAVHGLAVTKGEVGSRITAASVPEGLVGHQPGLVAALVLSMVTVVAFLSWLHVAYANLGLVGSQQTSASPAWVVGCWFVPFVNLYRPYEAVVETWQRSQDHNASPSTTQLPVPAVIGWWWGVFWISWVANRVAIDRVWAASTPGDLDSASAAVVAAAAISLAAAVLALVVVKGIDQRQRMLGTN